MAGTRADRDEAPVRTRTSRSVRAALATLLVVSLGGCGMVEQMTWSEIPDDPVLERTLTGALNGLGDAAHAVEDSPLTGALHLDDDLRAFREGVEDLSDELRRCGDEIQDLLGSAVHTIDALPDLVLSARVQIESLVFSDEHVQTAYDSCSQVHHLVERSALAFAEVGYQLADHRATTIDALADRVAEVAEDLQAVEHSLTVMLT